MDTLMALQNLAVTVSGLKESVNLQEAKVATISSKNIHAASKYHSRFGQLLYKYSVYANQYKLELDNLHESLLNDINFKRQEQEREFPQRLEILSNKSSQSNLEIVENVEQSEYSPEISANMNSMNINVSSSADYSQFEQSQNISWSDAALSDIQPMKAKKSIPVSPKPSPKKENKKKNKSKKSNGRNNKNQKKAKNVNKPSVVSKARPTTNPKPAPAKKIKTQKGTKSLIVRNVNDIQRTEQKNNKYVYNAKTVKFNLPFRAWNYETKKYEKKEYKHTTMIFVGNIPLNTKVAAVQYFIMKKFKVSMRQIVNTMLNRSRNGFNQYALVMFRSDVPKNHITKCMNTINRENAQIKENGKIRPAANANKTSWQTGVFIKYQDPEYHYSYYQNEDEMYNDPRARHELFITNFDILDQKFHRKFTEKLLKYGDLYEDIIVKIDHYGNPFCIVTFKHKNEAIYCCNSDVYFGGNRLNIRYSNKISYLDDLNKHQ